MGHLERESYRRASRFWTWRSFTARPDPFATLHQAVDSEEHVRCVVGEALGPRLGEGRTTGDGPSGPSPLRLGHQPLQRRQQIRLVEPGLQLAQNRADMSQIE